MSSETHADVGDLRSTMLALSAGTLDLDDCPESFVDMLTTMMKRTREELRQDFRKQREREAASPRPGRPAPDVELELLDGAGERTGQFRALADYAGLPVALVFGSYT